MYILCWLYNNTLLRVFFESVHSKYYSPLVKEIVTYLHKLNSMIGSYTKKSAKMAFIIFKYENIYLSNFEVPMF